MSCEPAVCVIIGLVVVAAIVAVLCMCSSEGGAATVTSTLRRAATRAGLLRGMTTTGVRDEGVGNPNSADSVDTIPAVARDDEKMYAAANVTAPTEAGNPLTDCAFKNLTLQGEDDPIASIADAFPNQNKGNAFVQETGMQGLTGASGNFVAQMRSMNMSCNQPDRQVISDRESHDTELDSTIPLRNQGVRKAALTKLEKTLDANPDLLAFLPNMNQSLTSS